MANVLDKLSGAEIQRLFWLARDATYQRYHRYVDMNGKPMMQGHTEPFATCAHQDCELTRRGEDQ